MRNLNNTHYSHSNVQWKPVIRTSPGVEKLVLITDMFL